MTKVMKEHSQYIIPEESSTLKRVAINNPAKTIKANLDFDNVELFIK
jgi:hypothetical protein